MNRTIVCMIVGMFIFLSLTPTIMSESVLSNYNYEMNGESTSIHLFKNIHGDINSLHDSIILYQTICDM